MSEWVKIGTAAKLIGVHPRTLYNWEEKGLIETKRTAGGMRLFNVNKYLLNEKINECKEDEECIEMVMNNNKYDICYARVSTINQKDDLERQKKELMSKYPNFNLITDIGSGMNLNKTGIRKIIDYAIEGKINKVVVCYKDRLARFGYELIEDLITKYSNGSVEILNQEEEIDPEEEVVKDVMMVMNVFIAKMNGLRKYGVIN